MPNNTNERKGKQAGELSAEERFRNFFSTSVIDLPEEMTRRDEPAPVEEKPKAGLLGKLFSHDKEETPAPAQPVLEIPTGEILLGADAKPVQPEQEDMALELRTADPVPAMPMQPASPEPAKAVPAEPVPAPKAAMSLFEEPHLEPQPEPEKPAPQPVPQPVAAPQKQPKAKNAPETLLPQEELEQREMQQLKDMLNGMSGKAKPAPQPAKPVQVAPQPKVQPAPAQPAAEPEKAPAKAAQNAAEELPLVVFASAPADPETLPKKPEKKSIFQMFGTAEDEKPAARKPEKEDTMSLLYKVYGLKRFRELGYKINVLIVRPSSGSAHTCYLVGGSLFKFSLINIFVIKQMSQIYNNRCFFAGRKRIAVYTGVCRCRQFSFYSFFFQNNRIISGRSIFVFMGKSRRQVNAFRSQIRFQRSRTKQYIPKINASGPT